jgi:hypothetical protein
MEVKVEALRMSCGVRAWGETAAANGGVSADEWYGFGFGFGGGVGLGFVGAYRWRLGFGWSGCLR